MTGKDLLVSVAYWALAMGLNRPLMYAAVDKSIALLASMLMYYQHFSNVILVVYQVPRNLLSAQYVDTCITQGQIGTRLIKIENEIWY